MIRWAQHQSVKPVDPPDSFSLFPYSVTKKWVHINGGIAQNDGAGKKKRKKSVRLVCWSIPKISEQSADASCYWTSRTVQLDDEAQCVSRFLQEAARFTQNGYFRWCNIGLINRHCCPDKLYFTVLTEDSVPVVMKRWLLDRRQRFAEPCRRKHVGGTYQ